MSRIRPKWLRDVEVGKGRVTYKGKRYSYTITPPEMADNLDRRKLPLHVAYVNKEFLFISDAIPANFRPFVLRHELREFIDFDGQPGSCRASLEAELAELPVEIYSEYITFRRQFFRELVVYYENHRPAFFEELRESLRFLEEVVAI